MKFLFIASYFESILHFRGDLIDSLLDLGIDVHVAAPTQDSNSEIQQKLEAKGVTVHSISLRRTGMNPLSDFSSFFCLMKLIRKLHPEYVFSYTVKPVIYGSLAAMVLRVPHRFALISGLGFAFSEEENGVIQRTIKKTIQRMYTLALSRVEKTFFHNRDDESLFRSLHILRQDACSIVVNGSGVDLDEFALSPLSDSPHFLLISRLLGDKGVREYAAAAKRVRATNPQAVFSLAGWIDDKPGAVTQSELNEWISNGDVKYLGQLDDVRPAISDSNVFVLPSYREGTPRTVLEAMAMGRPIITTDVPGCRETVNEEDNGFLVSAKSTDELVDAMERLISDPDLVKKMGIRSREIAVEKYNVHAVNKRMLEEMGIQ